MQIKIHQEGWTYFIVSSILTIIFFPFFPFIGMFFLVLSAYIFYFFRDPIRAIPTEDVIVSPADGLITYIGKSNAPKECNTKNQFLKISIFLNIFNVHVNRTPIAGKIKNIVYVPGKFINATLEKSSSDNERNIITIEKENKDIVIVSQIAGLIARRIICDLQIDEQVIQKVYKVLDKVEQRIATLEKVIGKLQLRLGDVVLYIDKKAEQHGS